MKIVFNTSAKTFSDLPIGATFKKDKDDNEMLFMKVNNNSITNTVNTVVLNDGSLIYTSVNATVISVSGTWSQEI